ncbi:MAG: response regulator [Dehalococcoidia bacterium]
MYNKPIEILLVEDNPADARLTVEAFKEGKVSNTLTVVGDGVEAMSYLRQEGGYAEAPRPDIILLDLNLPRKDGREVLAELKEDPDLRRIPVITLTTSRAEQDINTIYNLHGNCYVTKPVDLDRFIEVIRSIEGFWLTIVKLPADGLT